MHVENKVYKRNNKLLLCSINGTNREQDYLEMLRHNKVDGVVAITYSPIEHYLTSGIPFVSIDRTYSDIAIPCVSSDNDAGGREAAKQLISKGCQHLAFVGGHNTTINETKRRRISFEKYVQEHKIPLSIFDLDETVTDYYGKLESFLEENSSIDGIFTINDFTALDVIEILEKMVNVFLMMSKLLDTMELKWLEIEIIYFQLLNNHWKKWQKKRFVFCLI